MTAIERPLSPHLTVYRLPLAAWMSITHRMTGLALAVGVVALAAWLIAIALGPGPFAVVQDWAGSWLGIFCLAGWVFSLFYHLCNGIRHLLWDAGFGLNLSAIRASNRVVLVAGLGLTALALLLAFIVVWSGP